MRFSFLILMGLQFLTLSSHAVTGGESVPDASPIARSSVLILVPIVETDAQGKQTEREAVCSGVLIEKDLILTAAHCLNFDLRPQEFTIYLGNSAVRVFAKSFKKHRQYVDPLAKRLDNINDLGLIRLDRSVPASFRPIPLLQDASLLKAGAPMIVAGYGSNYAEPPGVQGILQQLQQNLFAPNLSRTEAAFKEAARRGSCDGDSGGPAYVIQSGVVYLWGILSRTRDSFGDCGGLALYTRILSHKSFLESARLEL